MTVIDLITRVDAICKKYEKYDLDKQKEANVTGDNAFARLYGSLSPNSMPLSRYNSSSTPFSRKSEAAATEKNRATAVAMNAEIRRIKARLLEELPQLQRLALKKVKGLSREELEDRNDLVSSLYDRIEAIPEGSTTAAKESGGGGGRVTPTSYTAIKIDSSSDGGFESEYFQQTEESDRFRQEYEMRRIKQDQGLEVIAEGLDTLKNMAHDMNEELDRQVQLMDAIDEKVDRAAPDLKSTNVRLKDTLNQKQQNLSFSTGKPIKKSRGRGLCPFATLSATL
ncbi:hypothetical protein CRYUN_Cryun01aG0226000 [Craigia yunnanensis]